MPRSYSLITSETILMNKADGNPLTLIGIEIDFHVYFILTLADRTCNKSY